MSLKEAYGLDKHDVTFKVGDKVRPRPGLIDAELFGPLPKGVIVAIEDGYDSAHHQKLNFGNGEGGSGYWYELDI